MVLITKIDHGNAVLFLVDVKVELNLYQEEIILLYDQKTVPILNPGI